MIGKRYEYDAMAECEKELWWYRSLHDITFEEVKKFPPNTRILDAGCGTGGLLNYLHANGYTHLAGFDLSVDAISYASRSKHFDLQLLNILECDSAYAKDSFDIIISHDILCLLQPGDDEKAFNKLVSLLKPGGLLLMNLPAGKHFKGTHDKAVGITKRYSPADIRKLAGTSVVLKKAAYWPFLLSPVIFSVRAMQRVLTAFAKNSNFTSDVKLPPRWLNRFFYLLTRTERRALKSTPWGSSLFVSFSKI